MSNGVTDLGTDIESLDQTPKPMTTLLPNSVIVKASTDGILNMQSTFLIPDEDAQNTGFSFSASKAAFLLHSMVLSLFPHFKLITYVFFRRIYFTVIFNSSYLLLVYTTSYSLFFYFSEIIYFPLIFSFQKIRVFIIFYAFFHYFNEIKFFYFASERDETYSTDSTEPSSMQWMPMGGTNSVLKLSKMNLQLRHSVSFIHSPFFYINTLCYVISHRAFARSINYCIH